jgi:tetratricopeptide (TPR) repeat protein
MSISFQRQNFVALTMALLGVSLASHPRTAAAQDFSLFGMGQSGVIRPQVYTYYNTWTWSPLFGPTLFGPTVFGPPTIGSGFPQPLGFQHISTGPNSYVYRPVTDLTMLVGLARQSIQEADYQAALVNLEPVLASAPDDGEALLTQSQALFGLGKFPESAEALHLAWRNLSREAWGAPVRNFKTYFRSGQEYTARLRALEAFVREHQAESSGHYLLGYHYGYLGYTAEATRELETAIKLASTPTVENIAAPVPVVAPPRAAPEPGPAPARDGPREF